MARDPKNFEIQKLLSITAENKYATAVAAFEIIDQLPTLELPKKWKNRKPAVQAMMAISDDMVKYGYIEDSQRTALDEELGIVTGGGASFATETGSAPAVEEEDEDLDEIGETAPVEKFAEESDYDDSDEDDSDSDDEDDSDDDSDEDDSDDDE